MKLNTKNFGMIDIAEEGIIDFHEGLPGFESVKKYILLDSNDKDSPFLWLQAVDEPELAFVVIDPREIKPDYTVDIDDGEVEALLITDSSKVLIYSIVVIPEDITTMTANLKAPLIINLDNRIGKQVVLDKGSYQMKHYILNELNGREVADDACSNEKEGTIYNNK